MPQATPKDWWYTQGGIGYATTSNAATTLITSPFLNANTIYPQQVQLSPTYTVQPPPLTRPVEEHAADYPEIANLRRRISEVTQLCAA